MVWGVFGWTWNCDRERWTHARRNLWWLGILSGFLQEVGEQGLGQHMQGCVLRSQPGGGAKWCVGAPWVGVRLAVGAHGPPFPGGPLGFLLLLSASWPQMICWGLRLPAWLPKLVRGVQICMLLFIGRGGGQSQHVGSPIWLQPTLHVPL